MRTQIASFPAAVRHMPQQERPRERLAEVGAASLRDAELIAIVLRTGTRTEGAVALAEVVIRHFGDLRGLARASTEEIQQIKGMGDGQGDRAQGGPRVGKAPRFGGAPTALSDWRCRRRGRAFDVRFQRI